MSAKTLIRALTMLLILCGVALAALLWRPARIEQTAPPPEAAATAPTLGQFIALDHKLPAPALAFTSSDGVEKHLADFKGQLVLVNLWATWCGPCVEEMPALDRLQQKLGDKLTILAISQDRHGAASVDPFLAKAGITHLAVFLDPKDKAIQAFGVEGLPTSFLIGRDGAMLGKVVGPAKWDRGSMLAMLDRYIEAK